MKAQNPFQYWQFGRLVETIDAAGRIEALRTMTALELRSVLELPRATGHRTPRGRSPSPGPGKGQTGPNCDYLP